MFASVKNKYKVVETQNQQAVESAEHIIFLNKRFTL